MRSIGQTLIAAHSLVWRNGTAPSRRDLRRGCGVLAEARPRSPDDTGQTRRRAALLHHPLGHHPKTRAADGNPRRVRQSAGQRRPSKAVQLCNFARRCRLPQIGFVTDSPLEGSSETNNPLAGGMLNRVIDHYPPFAAILAAPMISTTRATLIGADIA